MLYFKYIARKLAVTVFKYSIPYSTMLLCIFTVLLCAIFWTSTELTAHTFVFVWYAMEAIRLWHTWGILEDQVALIAACLYRWVECFSREHHML